MYPVTTLNCTILYAKSTCCLNQYSWVGLVRFMSLTLALCIHVGDIVTFGRLTDTGECDHTD